MQAIPQFKREARNSNKARQRILGFVSPPEFVVRLKEMSEINEQEVLAEFNPYLSFGSMGKSPAAAA